MNITNAVLVRLSIGQFNNSREDDSITKEVKVLHQLSGKAGKWVKIKLPETALEAIRKHASACRTEHYRLTLPWVEGQRLLPLSARAVYSEKMETLRKEFDGHVERFIQKYPEHVEEARKMHNGTFNESDYPDPLIVRRMFTFAVETTPVPAANHFSGIVGEELTRIRQELEATNAKRIEQAVADTWNRLLDPVSKMATTLASKDAIFRDSLVGNIRAITGLIPQLNVTGDPRLAKAAEEVSKVLGSLEPDLLRNSTVIRRQAADAASSFVKRFGALGVRKLSDSTAN